MNGDQDSIWAVGLMTGTVLDGNIDVALLKTDGQIIDTFGPYTLSPYRASTVELLRRCADAAQTWQFNGPEPTVFAEAEKRLTVEQGNAVSQLVEQAGLTMKEIGVIGFHGQTVLHRPPAAGLDGKIQGKTRQLGDGQLMAHQLGATVVSDFRSADMLCGGQGAPLSATYHRALLQALQSTGSTAVLNLGGVGNLTWWNGADQLLAFDTGPANAPINDFVQQMGQGEMDRDGRLAEQGIVDEARLATMLEHSYFTAQYPKSLDRFDFSWRMAEGLPVNDGAALLTAFSAAAVGKALDLLPVRPERLIVCGGGRHNPCLMQALEQRTSAVIEPAESVGWRGDAIEAECFAYLAVRVLRQLPTSFPQTTGASRAVCGGTISHPVQA